MTGVIWAVGPTEACTENSSETAPPLTNEDVNSRKAVPWPVVRRRCVVIYPWEAPDLRDRETGVRDAALARQSSLAYGSMVFMRALFGDSLKTTSQSQAPDRRLSPSETTLQGRHQDSGIMHQPHRDAVIEARRAMTTRMWCLRSHSRCRMIASILYASSAAELLLIA